MNSCTQEINSGKQFLEAAYKGNFGAVKKLCDAGANIDFVDENGDGALHHAVSSGNCELVEFLVGKLKNASVENVNGETPLIVAQKNQADSKIISGIREKIRNEVEDIVKGYNWKIINLRQLDFLCDGVEAKTKSFVIEIGGNKKVALILDFVPIGKVKAYYVAEQLQMHPLVRSKLRKINNIEIIKIKGWEDLEENLIYINDHLEYLRTINLEEINLKSLHYQYPKLINNISHDFQTNSFTYKNVNTLLMLLEIYKHDNDFNKMRHLIYKINGNFLLTDFSKFLKCNNEDFLKKLQSLKLSEIKASLIYPTNIKLQEINLKTLFHKLSLYIHSKTNFEEIIYEINVNITPVLYKGNEEEIENLRNYFLFAQRDEYFKNKISEILTRLRKFNHAKEFYSTLRNNKNTFIDSTNLSSKDNISEEIEFYLKHMMITECIQKCEMNDLRKAEICNDFKKLKLVSKDDSVYEKLKDDLKMKIPSELRACYDEIIENYVELNKELPEAIKNQVDNFKRGFYILLKLTEGFNIKKGIDLYENYLYGGTLEHITLHEIPKVGQIEFPSYGKVNYSDLLINMVKLFLIPDERKFGFENSREIFKDSVFLDYLIEDVDFNDIEFIQDLIKRGFENKLVHFIIAVLVKVGNDRVIDDDYLMDIVNLILKDNIYSLIAHLFRIDLKKMNIFTHMSECNIKNMNSRGDLTEVLKDKMNVDRFFKALKQIEDKAIIKSAWNLLLDISTDFSNLYLYQNILTLFENNTAFVIQNKHFHETDSIVLLTNLKIASAKYYIAKSPKNKQMMESAAEYLLRIKKNTSLQLFPHIHITSLNLLNIISGFIQQNYITGNEVYNIHRAYAFGVPIQYDNNVNCNQIKDDYLKIIKSDRYIELLSKSGNDKFNQLLYIINSTTNKYVKNVEEGKRDLKILNTIHCLLKQDKRSRETEIRMSMNKQAWLNKCLGDTFVDVEDKKNHYFIALEMYLNIHKLQKERYTNRDYTLKVMVNQFKGLLIRLASI